MPSQSNLSKDKEDVLYEFSKMQCAIERPHSTKEYIEEMARESLNELVDGSYGNEIVQHLETAGVTLSQMKSLSKVIIEITLA